MESLSVTNYVTVLLSEVCFQKVPEFAYVSYVSRHVTSKVETRLRNIPK